MVEFWTSSAFRGWVRVRKKTNFFSEKDKFYLTAIHTVNSYIYFI